MTLASIIHFVLGINIEPDARRAMMARETWRDAIHDNRGEAQKAIGTAHRARKASDEAFEALNSTIRAQEEAVTKTAEQNFLARLKELD